MGSGRQGSYVVAQGLVGFTRHASQQRLIPAQPELKRVTVTKFLSPTHVLLLLVVVLILFSAKRLPEFGRSLGSGLREFKHSLDIGSHDEPPARAAITAPDTTTPADNVTPRDSV